MNDARVDFYEVCGIGYCVCAVCGCLIVLCVGASYHREIRVLQCWPIADGKQGISMHSKWRPNMSMGRRPSQRTAWQLKGLAVQLLPKGEFMAWCSL